MTFDILLPPPRVIVRATPSVVPDEVCFESIKAGVDAIPPGTKVFLNSGNHSFLYLDTL